MGEYAFPFQCSITASTSRDHANVRSFLVVFNSGVGVILRLNLYCDPKYPNSDTLRAVRGVECLKDLLVHEP